MSFVHRFVLFGCRLQRPSARHFRTFRPLRQTNISIDEIVGQVEKLDVKTPVNENKVNYDNINQIVSLLRSSDDTNLHAISDDIRRDRINQVKKKVSQISEVADLRRLMQSVPQNISDRNLFLPVVVKIEEMLDMMDSSDIVDIFKQLSLRAYRDKDLLTQINEQLIRLKKILSPEDIVNVSSAMRTLSIYHPRLIKFLGNSFAAQLNNITEWNQVSTITTVFSSMRINSPAFWKNVCQWMDNHMENAYDNKISVQRIVASCAFVNVPAHLLQKPVEFVVEELKNDPRVKASPIEYMNISHNLAIFKSLSNYEANKILQSEFFNDLCQQYNLRSYSEKESVKLILVRAAIRILQIGSYCRHELSVKPKLPKNVLDFLEDKADLVQISRHGSSLETTVADFKTNFYISAPLKTHSLAPNLYISTGCFIDAVLWIDPKTRKILSIAEGQKSPKSQKVAILFGSFGLLTSVDAGATENDGNLPLSRPLGELRMNLRHLHAVGFKPVLIDYSYFSTLATNEQKIKFIKDSLYLPYENKSNDWH